MAAFTTRTIASLRHEWIVPAPERWGACIGDINAACAAACRAYRDARGLTEKDSIGDEALRFHVTDDAIIITFTTEETQ